MNKLFSISSAFLLLFAGAVLAQAETLTVSSGSGSVGDTVTLSVTLGGNTNGVAGAAFTLDYDSSALKLSAVRSNFFPTFSVQNINPEYIDVGTDRYYKALVVNTEGTMIAAARVDNGPTGDQTIFELDFNILSGASGDHTVGISPSVINNVNAGYPAGGAATPMLVGISGATYPERTATTTAGTLSTGTADSDGDGIADTWEISNFGNLTTADATSDFDKDGYSDLQEYNNRSTNDPKGYSFNPTLKNAPLGVGYNISTDNTKQRCDFNKDSKSDILWANSDGGTAHWLMDGASILSSSWLGTIAPNWQIVGIGDMDGDKQSDLLWRDTITGGTSIWFMDGNGKTSSLWLGTIDLSWKIVSLGDFDGNGTYDILWRDSNGAAAIWFMSGSGKTSSGWLGYIDLAWKIKYVADFNNNAKDDILWQDTSGNTAIWFMDGATKLSSGSLGAFDPSTWTIRNVGDFNGDGNSDIVWQDTGGATSIWFMNGANKIDSGFLGSFAPSDWTIIVEDFNGDRRSDILWRHSNGDTSIWFMDGANKLSSGWVAKIPSTWVIK